jgi:hypothetical protein
LCGGVRFELTEPAPTAGYCHCTRCQRRTGTAASAQAWIDGRTFRLIQGKDLVEAWRHPEGGFEKCFCRECGAHLFARNPDDPTQMSVRMGAFDGDPGVRPSWRAYRRLRRGLGAHSRRWARTIRRGKTTALKAGSRSGPRWMESGDRREGNIPQSAAADG